MDTRGKAAQLFVIPPTSNALRILKVPLHRRWYQETLTLAQETTNQGNKQQMVWKVFDEWVYKKFSRINESPRKLKRRNPLHSNTVSANRIRGRKKISGVYQGEALKMSYWKT
jgi:hypothetical protein